MQSSKQKNKYIFIAIILAVVLVATALYLIKQQNKQSAVLAPKTNNPVSTVNYGPPTAAEKQASDQQKQDVIKQQDLSNQAQQGVPPVNSSPQSQTLVVAIARASQPSAGQALAVRANITGTTNGECDITFSKDGQTTFTKVFSIALQATTSGCQGADIAASEFSVNGDWTMQIIAKNGSNQSAPVTQTVTVSK